MCGSGTAVIVGQLLTEPLLTAMVELLSHITVHKDSVVAWL